jgi:hypothetical protein
MCVAAVCGWCTHVQVELLRAKDWAVLESREITIKNGRAWNYSVAFEVPNGLCALRIKFSTTTSLRSVWKKGSKTLKPYGRLADVPIEEDSIKWCAQPAARLPHLAGLALLGVACAHLVFCLLLSFCNKLFSNLEKAATTLSIQKTGGKKALSLTCPLHPGKKPCR